MDPVISRSEPETAAAPVAQRPADLSFVDARFGDPVRVRPVFELYNNTKNVCLRLVGTGEQPSLMEGEPWATATVNAEVLEEADCVALKIYSENAGLAELLAQAGIIEPKVAGMGLDGITPLARLTPEALKLAEPTLQTRDELRKKRAARP